MSGNVSPLFAAHEGATLYSSAAEITRRVQPRDPVYLFSPVSLRNRAQRFRRDFPGAVSYAVKANPEGRVIDTLAAQGIGHFDVASIGEIEAVTGHHPGVALHFNNPIKAFEAIATAYRRYGVRSYALDEQAEFDKIKIATGNDRDILYSVRFKLAHEGASYDFGSKFGATPGQAVTLLKHIAAAGCRPALTFHPGSQCTDPGMYARYLEVAAEIVASADVAIAQVNVGGGFPEQYLNTRTPDLGDYFHVIEQAVERFFPERPPLMCEPGRAMVASSVSLLARIIHVRDDGRTVFLNDGVYGGMQEQSLVDLHLPVRVWREGRLLPGDSVRCRVFGPTCDPVDRLSSEMDLPARVRAGDYLEFGLLGAYGSATSTAFNGFRSAHYLNVASGFQAD